MTAGAVWRIQTPPSNWRSIACCESPNRMNRSAPNLTTSETILATVLSSRALRLGRKYSRQILRVKRLDAAMDMMDAGTRAPIAIEAKAKPANQDGNIWWSNAGTALFALYALEGLIPAA